MDVLPRRCGGASGATLLGPRNFRAVGLSEAVCFALEDYQPRLALAILRSRSPSLWRPFSGPALGHHSSIYAPDLDVITETRFSLTYNILVIIRNVLHCYIASA